MKTTKKIFAILMSMLVVLIYSMPVTAFAHGGKEDYPDFDWKDLPKIELDGHFYIPTDITPATCETNAVVEYTCYGLIDKHKDPVTMTKEIPNTALNHKVLCWKTTVAPTCMPGSKSGKCVRCGKIITEEIEPTGEHQWSEWVENTLEGVKTRTCSVCHAVQSCPLTSEDVYVYFELKDANGNSVSEDTTISVNGSSVSFDANEHGWFTLGKTSLPVSSAMEGDTLNTFLSAMGFGASSITAKEGNSNLSEITENSLWNAIEWTSLHTASGATDYPVYDGKIEVHPDLWHLDGVVTIDSLSYDANAPEGATVSGEMNPTAGLTGLSVSIADCAYSVDGYKFDGWYLDEACTKEAGNSFPLTSGNDVVYAKWLEDTEEVVAPPVYVYLNIVGGTSPVANEEYTIKINGKELTFTANNDGWFTLGSTTLPLPAPQFDPADKNNTTKIDDVKAFLAENGFDSLSDITGYSENGNYDTVRENYIWDAISWDSLKACPGAENYNTEDDLKLSPLPSKWHLDGTITVDSLSYNANAPEGKTATGEMEPSAGFTGMTVDVERCAFSVEGYDFDGWYTKDGTKYEEEVYKLTTGEDVLYAHWKAKSTDGEEEIIPPVIPPFTPESVYTVTYMDGVDDEVVFEDQSTTNLKKGDKTPAFTGEPVRAGYKFIGWSPEVAETVSGDAVYYAQWEKLPEEPAVVDPSGDNDPIDDGKDIDAQPNGDADTDVEAKGVKTGDETMLAMWGALGLIAALGLGGTLVIGRRREE